MLLVSPKIILQVYTDFLLNQIKMQDNYRSSTQVIIKRPITISRPMNRSGMKYMKVYSQARESCLLRLQTKLSEHVNRRAILSILAPLHLLGKLQPDIDVEKLFFSTLLTLLETLQGLFFLILAYQTLILTLKNTTPTKKSSIILYSFLQFSLYSYH